MQRRLQAIDTTYPSGLIEQEADHRNFQIPRLSANRRRFIEEAARAEFSGQSIEIPAGIKLEIEKHGSLAKWIAADFVRKAAYDNWLSIFSGKHKIPKHKRKSHPLRPKSTPPQTS
ncbi:hypothetical protein ACRBEV_25630 [Methylobacterium phyllosphaerae]